MNCRDARQRQKDMPFRYLWNKKDFPNRKRPS